MYNGARFLNLIGVFIHQLQVGGEGSKDMLEIFRVPRKL